MKEKENQENREIFWKALENHKKNNFQVAKELYENILQTTPDHFDSIFLLGSLHLQTKNLSSAEKFLMKAIKINPNHADAHNNLGILFKELGKFKKATEYFERAISTNSVFAEAYYNLGLVHYELDSISKAKICYEKAIQINSKYSDAYNNLGILFKELGEFKKAIDCYEKAIKYKPENLVYIYHLSELKKEILDSNLKEKIIKIINNENCTKKNKAYGNLLLSNYEFNLKNYENEFNLLLKGHFYYFNSQKEKFEEEAKYWLKILPETEQLVNFSKKSDVKEKNDQTKPIFIIGVPRCGSTLIEKIMASGDKFISIGEEKNIIGKTVKELINSNKLLTLDMGIVKKLIYEKYNDNGLLKKENGHTFTDKSLDNFFYLILIKNFFPKAKIVNCKRNSLSSIMSILKNNLVDVPWAHNLEHIFKYYDNYLTILKNFEKKFPKFIYNLQYEEFINDPEKESKKLFKFCDLPWDKKCLEFYKRTELTSKTASSIQIRNPIFKETANKYLPYKKLLNEYGSKYSWFIKDSE